MTVDAPCRETQQLINTVRKTPQVNFSPFPTYAGNYLTFAMASSIEVTQGVRVWTCWAGGKDGSNAYLLASYSDDKGKSWRNRRNQPEILKARFREEDVVAGCTVSDQTVFRVLVNKALGTCPGR